MKTDAKPEIVLSMMYKWELERGVHDLTVALRLDGIYDSFEFYEIKERLENYLNGIIEDMVERGLPTNVLGCEHITELESELAELYELRDRNADNQWRRIERNLLN